MKKWQIAVALFGVLNTYYLFVFLYQAHGHYYPGHYQFGSLMVLTDILVLAFLIKTSK